MHCVEFSMCKTDGLHEPHLFTVSDKCIPGIRFTHIFTYV